MNTIAKSRLRNQKGSLAGVLLATIILCAVVLGAMAVDFFHMHTVQTELQNATDAAALAGAQDLYVSPSSIEFHALRTAALNSADGLMVSSSTPGTSVAVEITQPSMPSSPGQVNGQVTGQVKVTASMNVSHLLAPVVGRLTDNISASSTAARVYLMKRIYANQAFPIAVSWDQAGPDGLALSGKQLGDQVQFVLSSQSYKNAAWTSLSSIDRPNSNMVKGYVDVALGLTPKKGEGIIIPSVTVGQPIGLSNGVVDPGIARNSPENAALLDPNTIVTLPVIVGDPAYNHFLPVVGFIGVRFTEINRKGNGNGQGITFIGTLVKTMALGDDVPSAPDPQPGLESYSVGPVKLIQ